ncbi:MAG: M1 family aminopeptidase [Burkholderiales bacterium]|jgi:ABC-2 type transport system permease protein
MLTKIAAFELRYQLRSPLFVVGFVLFFLMTFASVTIDQVQIGGRGNVNVNSPYALLQTLGLLNVFALFVVTAFVANVVIRDDETRFAPIVRATRVSKFDYLVGRFSGAVIVAMFVMASVPLGMLIGSWMPWLDAEKVGPFVLTHYLYAFFVFGLPTILVMSAGFFAVATATRSMMWTYVAVVAFLVLFATTRLLLRDSSFDAISALSDPFGLGALQQATKYWTASDRNTMLPSLSGLILYNRVIWLSVALALFGLAYAMFRFELKGAKVREKTGAAQEERTAIADIPPIARPLATTDASGGTRWRQFMALTRFDMGFVFKSPAFFVLLAIGVFNALGSMNFVVEQNGVNYFPVTRAMIESLQGAFNIIPIIIAIYYAGELVWRDRERRIHEIVDATAAPDWAFIIPKVLAITLVLLASFAVAALTAILFQLFHGYTYLQLYAYLLWFILPGLISAVLLAALAIFVQALVPQKFVGWAVMLVYVVASVTLNTIGLEHNLYNYGGEPGVPLSDMNGLGRFWIGRAWFQAYWLAFALMLLVATHLLWRRGAETRLRPRFDRLRSRLSGGPGLIIGAAGVAWVGIGVFIFYNTNVLNRYETGPERERFFADYEKTLLPYEKLPQPKITDVVLDVAIFPKQARVITSGSYVIENRSSEPLPAVHVRWSAPLKMETLDVEGASTEKEYKKFDYRIYRFTTPMQPGEKRTIRFTTRLEERGFPNSRPLTRVVENGTFIDNFTVAPILGMGRDMLLQDRSRRRKHDLPADLRPPKLEDQAANDRHYLRADSDWVNAQITVSTDADQTPVAPGYMVSDVVKDSPEGKRRVLVTKTEAPIMNFFSMQSARYAQKRDVWTSSTGKQVDLAVYYHPAHEHNVQRMLDAMKSSLDLFNDNFSPYQFKQARVLEFPAYEGFAQSFAATIPYSESIGFIQNFDEKRADEKIDQVTFVTAHEVAHQWWAHQVIGANKQGMTLLSESFAQYSALLVMEKLYGREQIRKFLKTELDRYLRARGGEVIEELPLIRVENQNYIHYNKGALVMYWLKEAVGEAVVNRALQELLAEFAFKPAPYASTTDFIRLLRAEAGPQHDQLITDLFEKITLYDMKATDANAKKRADGMYEASFSVEAKKLYADGNGKETEAALDEAFDVGAFTEEPGNKGYKRESVLLMDRRVMKTGRQTVTFITDKLPKFVGIDPYNKRIDRNSDDNIARVVSD